MKRIITKVLLTLLALTVKNSFQQEQCTILDSLNFRKYIVKRKSENIKEIISNQFIVSLCDPINPKTIKQICNNKITDEIFFLHIVEPEFKNCLLFKKSDVSISYYNNNKKTVHILISIPEFKFKNGIIDELNYDIVLFDRDSHIKEPRIEYREASKSYPYNTIKVVLPKEDTAEIDISNYALTSLNLRIGISTVQRLIMFLLLFYVYFSFHLDTKLSEKWEYPIQGVLMLHFLISFSLIILGLIGSSSLIINSILQILIVLIGMIKYVKLVGKFKRNFPLWLNLIVIPEAYVALAQNFDKYSLFFFYTFFFFSALFILGSFAMCLFRVSKHKMCHFDELIFSVFTSIRLTVYLFNMHKPYKNLFKVGKVLAIRSTYTIEEIGSLFISFCIFSCCFTTFRIIAMASLRKTEKKILFEEYYNNLDDYMGSRDTAE